MSEQRASCSSEEEQPITGSLYAHLEEASGAGHCMIGSEVSHDFELGGKFI